MTSSPQLKPIPRIATRAMIYDMYKGIPRNWVRSAIQLSIKEINNTSGVQRTKKIQVLTSKHIAIIVDELGDAPGYQSLEV